MKKKNIVILSIVAIVIILLFIYRACSWIDYKNHYSDYSNVIWSNWKIRIPADARYEVIYGKDDGPSFNGDGWRYHIYSYEEAEPIERMFVWEENEGKARYDLSYREAVSEWLEIIGVPESEYPDYSDCKYWYDVQTDGSEIIIIWNSDRYRLYIAESFL